MFITRGESELNIYCNYVVMVSYKIIIFLFSLIFNLNWDDKKLKINKYNSVGVKVSLNI